MKLVWMGEYRELIEMLIRYCNNYAQNYNVERNFNTPVNFSYAQLQVMEYILENEDRRENMAAVASRLGVTPSLFSKHTKKMVSKGLLEKYRNGNNKKDIIIRISPLGREVYEQYAKFVYSNGFGAAFKILDEIPKEYIQKFTQILDIGSRSSETSVEKSDVPPLVKIE